MKKLRGNEVMAVNDKEAIERMAKRLKVQADEIRELEKNIFTDYRNGMDLHDIAKKNDCTYKRVVLTLNKEMR